MSQLPAAEDFQRTDRVETKIAPDTTARTQALRPAEVNHTAVQPQRTKHWCTRVAQTSENRPNWLENQHFHYFLLKKSNNEMMPGRCERVFTVVAATLVIKVTVNGRVRPFERVALTAWHHDEIVFGTIASVQHATPLERCLHASCAVPSVKFFPRLVELLHHPRSAFCSGNS